MNFKELFYKVGKGALSGVIAIAGGLLTAGIPLDKHAVFAVLGAIASAAFHGGANAVEQYVKGPDQR
jgi:hypothetical protein